MPIISPPATVLVTGSSTSSVAVTPYVGRCAPQAKWKIWWALVARKQPQAKDRFRGYVVEDLSAEGAFDESLDGVHGAIHTASPVSPASDDPEAYSVPAAKGTISVLKSALKVDSVKRVVIVSSMAATASAFVAPAETYTEEDWNEQAVEIVAEQGKSALAMLEHDASKVLAERAAWDFYEKHKSHAKYDLTVINPAWVFGPLADDTLPSPASLPATPSHFYNMLFARPTPKEHFPVCTDFVHVHDVSETLIRALEVPEAGGQRIISNAFVATWAQWLYANQTLNLVPALETASPDDALKPLPPHVYFANDKS